MPGVTCNVPLQQRVQRQYRARAKATSQVRMAPLQSQAQETDTLYLIGSLIVRRTRNATNDPNRNTRHKNRKNSQSCHL
ncbi:hypothetical protein CFP56_036222 [Quercus suber]|uniref:Uncharacterized protein n=1 Tax=Quercus suber TaxID=58331 RepID=A0AAW0J834_QUESU